MNCEYCGNNFCSKSSVTNHQWTAVYCIEKRNTELKYLRKFVAEQAEIITNSQGKLLEKETTIFSLEEQLIKLKLKNSDMELELQTFSQKVLDKIPLGEKLIPNKLSLEDIEILSKISSKK